MLECGNYLAALFARLKMLNPTPAREPTRIMLRGNSLNNPITEVTISNNVVKVVVKVSMFFSPFRYKGS